MDRVRYTARRYKRERQVRKVTPPIEVHTGILDIIREDSISEHIFIMEVTGHEVKREGCAGTEDT